MGKKSLFVVMLTILLVASVAITGCGNKSENSNANTEQPAGQKTEANQGNAGTETKTEAALSGTINIAGSSTVYPITKVVAEDFQKANKDVRVPIQVTGTGGGFKQFVKGDVEINNASRAIKESEAAEATANGIEVAEYKIGLDGITVVINSANDWAKEITTEQLKKMWEPAAEGKVMKWSDIDPAWPDEKINFYSPGTDSGTFGFFTEAIVGEEGSMRTDVVQSEDDNVLVMGVAGDKYAIGYFGYAYYVENKDTLQEITLDGVAPTVESINNGSYAISRPLYLYVNVGAIKEKPELKAFLTFYFENGKEYVASQGYVPLNDEDYQKLVQEVDNVK